MFWKRKPEPPPYPVTEAERYAEAQYLAKAIDAALRKHPFAISGQPMANGAIWYLAAAEAFEEFRRVILPALREAAKS